MDPHLEVVRDVQNQSYVSWDFGMPAIGEGPLEQAKLFRYKDGWVGQRRERERALAASS